MPKNEKKRSTQEGGKELLKQARRTANVEKGRISDNQSANQNHNSRKVPLGPNTDR